MGERSKCVNLLQKIREIEILSFREEYYTKRIRSTFPNREPFHGPLSFVRRISVFNSGYPPPPNVCSSVSMNSRTGRGDCDNIKHVSLSLSLFSLVAFSRTKRHGFTWRPWFTRWPGIEGYHEPITPRSYREKSKLLLVASYPRLYITPNYGT